MTFFNWQNSQGGSGGGSSSSSSDNSTSADTSSSNPSVVSTQVWIYFAVAVPLTLFVVLIWWIWERRREKRYAEEDDRLEKDVEAMEMGIQTEMRKRTLSKVETWNTKPSTGD
jgi:hypothetical protein